jgi:hypothetical protein
MLLASSAGDWHNPWPLRHNPGQRDLRQGCILTHRKTLSKIKESLVRSQRFWLEVVNPARRSVLLSKLELAESLPARNPIPSGPHGGFAQVAQLPVIKV